MRMQIANKAIITFTVAALGVVTCAQGPSDAPRGERTGPGRGGPPQFMSPLLRTFDLNGDGTIDAAEMAKAAETLKSLDANKDGKLTADELRPGGGPGMPPPGGGFGGPQGRSGRDGSTSFTSKVQPKSDTEKKILAVLADMSQNQRRGSMSVPDDDGRILRVLAESIGAKHVVEIGTSIGYSAVWFAMALEQTGGKLTTYEIDAGRAAKARENFKRAGVEGIVTLVEGDAHEEVKKLKGPIDLLFLDADKEGYLDYLNKLLPLVRPGGLIVAHNMNQRQADARFVKAITSSPELETLFLDMETSGIGVTLKKR